MSARPLRVRRGPSWLLVELAALRGDEASSGEPGRGPGDGGLAHERLDGARHGERTEPIERREERDLGRLGIDAEGFVHLGRVRLETLGEALQPASEEEVTEVGDQIGGHSHYITRYLPEIEHG